MFTSKLEAYRNPLIEVRISSIVESGYCTFDLN